MITNHRGKTTLSAYAPLELQTERWALVAERGRDEVMKTYNNRWSIAAGVLAGLVTFLILMAGASAVLFKPASAREDARELMKRAKPTAT